MLSVGHVCYEKNKARKGNVSHDYGMEHLKGICKTKSLIKNVVNIK